MKTIAQATGLLSALIGIVAVAACTAKAPAPAPAAPDSSLLQQQVMGTVHVCSSCHGMDGNSVSPTFPKLAGQRMEYLKAQLLAFRDHTRADPHAHTYMWGMAAHLTDPQIDGLATYFSSQKMSPGVPGNPADMAAGQKLFLEGNPDREIPACMACHGQNAEGQDAFPRLASQHRDYMIEQIAHFRTNARANEIMHENSMHLSADEARQVATFLAAQ
jgi:cytochrome c553